MKFDFNDKDFSIWFSKNIKAEMKEKAKIAKGGRCYLCDADCSSFCNSHSIPQFVLKHLTKSGQYSNSGAFSKIDFIKPVTGKNDVGTFHLICKDCDSAFFKDYENPLLYDFSDTPLRQNILFQIAIKNLLFQIDKANDELSSLYHQFSLAQNADNQNSFAINSLCEKSKRLMLATGKRLECYEKVLQYDRYCYDEKKRAFKILIQKYTNYKIPIAMQTIIPVSKGLSGETINDFKNVLHFLHVCLFPIENNSLILIFCHSADDYYNQFEKDIKNKSLLEQLEIINYHMVFRYSEDYYCNIDTMKSVCNDTILKKVCRELSECDLSNPILKIPNLLTKEYSLKGLDL